MQYNELPILSHADEISDAVRNNQTVIIESPTGTGKTTQIPLILYRAGLIEEGSMLGITQPRRLAAQSVAAWTAKELGTSVGDIVGYKIRFDDVTSINTRIKIMTDGILLQELQHDPDLSRYSIIIIDEAHERSLNIDFCLGLIKWIMPRRPDLKVIVTSATINPGAFSRYFSNAPILSIPAKSHHVEIKYKPLSYYAEPKKTSNELIRKIKEAVEEIEEIYPDLQESILIFMSGESAIKSVCQSLKYDSLASHKRWVLPLFARLRPEEQELVFKESLNKRKIIVATNIAETSLTIPGIRAVIDSGLVKLSSFFSDNRISSLIEGPISKASAKQRAGRAGRTKPGICIRLYSKPSFNEFPDFTKEEIFRHDLSEVVLRMISLGIKEVENFPFLSAPSKRKFLDTLDLLKELQAIDKNRDLTETGARISEFPIEPRYGRMIIEAVDKYWSVTDEVLILTAFLTSKNPYLLPAGEEELAREAHKSFYHRTGDFIAFIRLFRKYTQFQDLTEREEFCRKFYLDNRVMEEIVNIHGQMKNILENMQIPVLKGGSNEQVHLAVSTGLLDYICRRESKGTYANLHQDKIFLHPSSSLYKERPEYIIAGEIVKTSKIYARSVSIFKEEWIKIVSKSLFSRLVLKRKRDKSRIDEIFKPPSSIMIQGLRIPVFQRNHQFMALLRVNDFAKLNPPFSTEEDASVLLKIKGALVFGRIEFLSGTRLDRLLVYMEYIDLKMEPLSDWPKYRIFNSKTTAKDLIKWLPFILYPVVRKVKAKKGYLLALTSNGKDNYWFEAMHRFTDCIYSSRNALAEFIENAKTLSREDKALCRKILNNLKTISSETGSNGF
ncbi:MAG: DEAD/DEAH box helicase [Candidatus Coatesbacteria bacterium]|nr:DEAD/DEAH box helicase [Candidatus Coatesbacteria bacterium]